MNGANDTALKMLNVLMTAQRPISTSQLCDFVGCERKAVYANADKLELAGFSIEAQKVGKSNEYYYRFVGVCGF